MHGPGTLLEHSPQFQAKVAAFTDALEIFSAEQWYRDQMPSDASDTTKVKVFFHRELLAQVEQLLDQATIDRALDNALLGADEDVPDLTAWALRIRSAAEVAGIDLERIVQLVRSEQ